MANALIKAEEPKGQENNGTHASKRKNFKNGGKINATCVDQSRRTEKSGKINGRRVKAEEPKRAGK